MSKSLSLPSNAASVDADDFIRQENIALFRKCLAGAADDATRQILWKLLAEEERRKPP